MADIYGGHPRTSRFALASFVLGVPGLVLPFPAVLAILFGIQGRRRITASSGAEVGTGLATVGIILGAIGLVTSTLVVLLI